MKTQDQKEAIVITAIGLVAFVIYVILVNKYGN
jgi:preprotein translocase subunit Sss1